MNKCIFPGKFTPFHNGHLMVIKGMAKLCDQVIIAVCHSSNEGNNHLFTKEETQEMISEALMIENLLEVEIHFIPDCESDEEWLDRVSELAEGDDFTLWSGNPEILSLFSENNFKTKEIIHVPGHDSQEILDSILAKSPDWKNKVPPAITNIISKAIDKNS